MQYFVNKLLFLCIFMYFYVCLCFPLARLNDLEEIDCTLLCISMVNSRVVGICGQWWRDVLGGIRLECRDDEPRRPTQIKR